MWPNSYWPGAYWPEQYWPGSSKAVLVGRKPRRRRLRGRIYDPPPETEIIAEFKEFTAEEPPRSAGGWLDMSAMAAELDRAAKAAESALRAAAIEELAQELRAIEARREDEENTILILGSL